MTQPDQPRAAAPPVGESRDEMVGQLGVGGMAEVLLIRRRRPGGFEKYFALKRIRSDLDDSTYGAMLLDEARIVALLQHPHIVQVHDLGRDAQGLWFLMEYVHGRSAMDVLNRAIERKLAVPLGCTAYIVACVAQALHYAHDGETAQGRLGVVHRDVSPGNLLIGFDGQVKLADFGVARAAHRLTHTEGVKFKGKYGYASPEQCRGEPLTAASDLFSLGVVLYELITRRRLFHGDSPLAVVHQVISEPLPTPSWHRSDCPPALDAIVARMLSRPRETRYAHGAEVAAELTAFAHAAGVAASREAMAGFMAQLFSAAEMEMAARIGEPTSLQTLEIAKGPSPWSGPPRGPDADPPVARGTASGGAGAPPNAALTTASSSAAAIADAGRPSAARARQTGWWLAAAAITAAGVALAVGQSGPEVRAQPPALPVEAVAADDAPAEVTPPPVIAAPGLDAGAWPEDAGRPEHAAPPPADAESGRPITRGPRPHESATGPVKREPAPRTPARRPRRDAQSDDPLIDKEW